jgi:imidazolonepropionase-like amidohydrolase
MMGWCSIAVAQDESARTLFTNVHVFDGVSPERIENANVLVEGNLITSVSTDPIGAAGATVIDGGGRTLMPGLIDAHIHLASHIDYREIQTVDEYAFAYVGAEEAKKMLLRGFTTGRDMGGNTYTLKKFIDESRLVGPRIYPSGPPISQTGGHADYRPPNAPSRLLTKEPQDGFTRTGNALLADGPAEMLVAVRENLRRGSSQIKILIGGGAASPADPLDTVQFTPEEVRAAVMAAQNWNTYVAAHGYNPKGIRMAVENGVKSIEHANLIDEAAFDLVVENSVWLSVQALVFVNTPAGMDEGQKERFGVALAGLDTMFGLVNAKGYDKIAFGTDVIGDPALFARQNEEFTLRTRWFDNAEVLRQATSGNAQLLGLSGPRNPYPGKLGVIEIGALADLLLVDGNPLENMSVMTDPEVNFDLIMKDGAIYKNTIN